MHHSNTILFLLSLLTLFTPIFCDLPYLDRFFCRPKKLTDSFCSNPPVVKDVLLPAYANGPWYQLATSDFATQVSSTFCTTANYTLNSDGSVAVLNCQFPPQAERARCVRGVATRRDNINPARLQVQFSPSAPPGPYNIAALLGNPNYGYYAAAVYGCEKRNNRFEENLFFIARSPFQGKWVTYLLRRKLQCMGYRFKRDVVFTEHSTRCKYFFFPEGFSVFTPSSRPR